MKTRQGRRLRKEGWSSTLITLTFDVCDPDLPCLPLYVVFMRSRASHYRRSWDKHIPSSVLDSQAFESGAQAECLTALDIAKADDWLHRSFCSYILRVFQIRLSVLPHGPDFPTGCTTSTSRLPHHDIAALEISYIIIQPCKVGYRLEGRSPENVSWVNTIVARAY